MRPGRIVCFRTDRMGDMLLTMPAMAAIKKAYPDAHLAAVCSPLTLQLLEGQPWLDKAFPWEARDDIIRLIGFLRRERFDTAIFFFPRVATALASFAARIGRRVGTAYRWYSPLFTDRVKIHRSANLFHELEYNYRLLSPLGIEAEAELKLIPPVISDGGARTVLREEPGEYLVVHPGSGGSALNAGWDYYARLVASLRSRGHAVLLTCGPADSAIVARVARKADIPPDCVIRPAGLRELGRVLAGARAVIGPATGPIHLAASLGVPVVALFAPLHSQQPRRWAPLGPKVKVLLPHSAVCPSCPGEPCPMYNCVERIAPESVAAAAEELIRR